MHRLGAVAVTLALLLLAAVVGHCFTSPRELPPEILAVILVDLVLWGAVACLYLAARISGTATPTHLRTEVAQLIAEELGARESALSQGYAEGYVDGIARRQEGSSRN
ncbi:hypothetical protein [Micromonospora sp. S-DT3-3-22]|uniref:hypothetical protein n=1 Tax=Micromonospora sp. S-DT3-3-22 TaxID=2755359 RepID=UPI00188EC3CA|nr:hypothetical protein [Micromonospora sp. S-DT3-3-22]